MARFIRLPARPLALLAAWLLALGMSGATAASDILIVLSGEGAHYQEVADAIAAELSRPPAIAVGLQVIQARAALPESRFTVAVGALAAEAASAKTSRNTIINALLPRASFESLMEHGGRRPEDGRVSAVYLDQPVTRQLDLLRLALPDRSRVGVLLGRQSQENLPAARLAADRRRLRLVTEPVADDKEIFPALQRLLPEIDVLLALPDARVFNSHTVSNILLASYRSRIPVMGFSAAYIKAGALIGVYSTPAQIGQQVGELLRQVLSGGGLPGPQYPRYFEVGVNAHVARSLGLELEPPPVLKEKLQRLERLP